MGKNMTIYDLAKEANVSPSMISRVYNKKKGVSKAKREMIEKLIEKYHFVPDEIAKSLKKERTYCIGIVASDICNPFFARIIYECNKIAENHGYSVYTYETHDSPEVEMDLLNILSAQKFEAVILLGGESDWVEVDTEYYECISRIARFTPVITMGRMQCENVYNVITDEARAMRTLLEFLIDRGHRQFFFIGGISGTRSYTDKVNQFWRTLKENNLSKDESCISTCGYEKEISYQVMTEMLHSKKNFTAVIAVNETVAIGSLRAIKEFGLSVPNDISVACFDNSFISESTKPMLTTVGCSYEQFGQKLIYAALEAIDSGNKLKGSQEAIVESVFVIRDSVQDMHIR